MNFANVFIVGASRNAGWLAKRTVAIIKKAFA